MKKWWFFVLALLVFSSLAYAQTVNTAELKIVLIDSIKDYLSSQTPKLEKAELKDLIVVYLSTKSDTAGLSGTGHFSGKRFIDIYNQAKGITIGTDVPPSTPGEIDPSVPHITGTIRGGAWGVTGTIVGQNEKSYYIVLPDDLPFIGPPLNPDLYREAVPKGTPYSVTIEVVDSAKENSGNTFYLTLKKPSGEIIREGGLSGGVTVLRTLARIPPGTYLVTVKIKEFAPGVNAVGFMLGLSTDPGLAPGELK